MAKRSTQMRKALQQEGKRSSQEYGDFMGTIRDRLGSATGRGEDLFNQAYGGFNQLLNRPKSPYGDMFMNAARGGLISDENRSRIRGKGVFDEFAQTGGYSDADKTNIRSRSNRTIPAFYDAIRDRLNQQAEISGAGPSYSASLSRAARDQSRAASDQAQDTEFDIMNAVNEGRKWGTSGLSNAETALTNLETLNKRFGIEGGAQNELANYGLDLEALGGLTNLRSSRPGEEFGLYDLLLGAMGQRGSQANANLGQRASYDPNVSWFNRMMQMWQNFNGTIGAARGGV